MRAAGSTTDMHPALDRAAASLGTDRVEKRLASSGGWSPQSFRRERGFVATLIGPNGPIGESPLMISENSARRWAAEHSRGKTVSRVHVRQSFVDPER